MKKKLSIIIPHFNSVNSLNKLLKTIPLDSDFVEVIVIDDKSHQTEVEKLEILKNKFQFKLFFNEDIKSAGTCRNIGLKEALGSWVLFADSDDYFYRDFLIHIEKYFESKSEVVFFKPTSIYEETNTLANRHINFSKIVDNYVKNKNNKNTLKLRYNIPNPICKLIKKEFLISNNIYFDEVIASNDVMFSLKVGFYMKKFLVDKNIIYVITKNSSSLTSSLSKNIFDSRINVLLHKHKFLSENLSNEDYKTLDVRYTGFLITALKHFGLMSFYNTLFLFFKYKVPVFKLDYLNLNYLVKRYELSKINKKDIKKYSNNKKFINKSTLNEN